MEFLVWLRRRSTLSSGDVLTDDARDVAGDTAGAVRRLVIRDVVYGGGDIQIVSCWDITTSADTPW